MYENFSRRFLLIRFGTDFRFTTQYIDSNRAIRYQINSLFLSGHFIEENIYKDTSVSRRRREFRVVWWKFLAWWNIPYSMAIFNGTVVRLVPSFLKVSSLFPFEESDSWKQVEEKNGVEGVWTASYYDGEIYEKNFNFHVRKLAGTITPQIIYPWERWPKWGVAHTLRGIRIII